MTENFYSQKPMDTEGRRPRAYNRNLGVERYKLENRRVYRGSLVKTNKARKCFICKKTRHLQKNCPIFKENCRNYPKKACTVTANTIKKINTYKVILKINDRSEHLSELQAQT